MVKIKFNQELFDLHCEVIKKELEQLITKVCDDKKIIKKRKKDNKFENYDYLTRSQTDIDYLKSLNLDMLLKAKFLNSLEGLNFPS